MKSYIYNYREPPVFKYFLPTIFISSISFSVVAEEIDYKQVQTDLNRMGYKVGTADGIPGRNTERGISSFFNDAGYITPEPLTAKDLEFIHNVANYTDKPLDLIKEVITLQTPIKSLSDEQLCEVNTHIDLYDVFYELKRRELECPSGMSKSVGYDGDLLHNPTDNLDAFKIKYDIDVPIFDLQNARTFNEFDATRNIYYQLNPSFSGLLSQDSERIKYCAEWMPNISFFAPDPSKNLDGSGSWVFNTMVDGSVICEDSISNLYFSTLSKNEKFAETRLKQFQNIIDTMVSNEGGNNFPYRAFERKTNPRSGKAYSNFTYLRSISKLSAGVELLNNKMNWSDQDKKRYSEWLKNRALQVLPVSGRNQGLGEGICDLNVNPNKMNDSCQNAAPFAAHLLLRAAITAQDQVLAELSYLVFKQYSSGLRNDGSQAADSIRDCYAAGYTIWAAQFLHDYVYLASRAGVDLWDDRFSETNGSPKENIEYALQIRENPSLVNKYAEDFGYPDCVVSKSGIVQKGRPTAEASFAYYYSTFAPEKLDGMFLDKQRQNLQSYSSGSGVNYEIDIMLNDTDLGEYFVLNKAKILEERERISEIKKLEQKQNLLVNNGFKPILGTDPYAGSYRVKWYFKNSATPGSPREYQSVDTMVLRGGTGEFKGERIYSQPSSNLRKALFIAYTADGKIHVEGDLDLFDVGRYFPTILKGTLIPSDDPEITGVWAEGDIFEIELEKIE